MSEVDLTIIHVIRKAYLVTDDLLDHSYLDPAKVTVVSISVEYDLLADIFLAWEKDSSNTFCDLSRHDLAGNRGMCMND